MTDWHQITAAIAIFYKKSLLVFVLVAGTDDRIVAQLGMIVKHCHARSLLKIRSGNDLKELTRREALAFFLPARGDDDQGKHIQRVFFQHILRQDDFRSITPGSIVLGEDPADRFVPAGIAAESIQDRGNIFQQGLDPE